MTGPIDIFITSWLRPEFTQRTLEHIIDRTDPDTYRLHVLDNESTPRTREPLIKMLDDGKIHSLLLHSINTRCLWGKAVFNAMVESKSKYYVVSDNDILPPKLENGDWLSRMVKIMDNRPEIAFLTPQLPPTYLQLPYAKDGDVVYCKAVGNTFKMVRREAYPPYPQSMGAFGDDGLVSELVRERGYQVAFCSDIFCLHLGQTDNWGYESEEIDRDPRKAGYGAPFRYTPEDTDTFRPPEDLIFSLES
jgi:glycosyltransferase involved in cell wall biosynthesis